MSRTARRLIAGTAVLAALTLGTAALASPAVATPRVPAASGGEPARHNPTLKQMLSEGDDDDGPDAPVVAQCQKYIGQGNPYDNTYPDVDMVVNDNFQSTGSSGGCSTPQNELTIASNPENPNNIVAGSNDYRPFNAREGRNDSNGYAYTSMDGGKTWTNVLLPALTYQTGARGALNAMDAAGDPVLSFGPNNTVYYGTIVFGRGAPAAGGSEAPSGIVVSISHDGGLSFDAPKIIELDGVNSKGRVIPSRVFNDKIWLAADPNSGNVYVTWTRFLDTPDGGYAESPIVISVSHDGGKSFSAERRIDPPASDSPGLQPYSQGSNPRVAPDGTLYVAYEGDQCATSACDQPGDRDVTVVAKSTDHGASFTRSIVDTDYDFPDTLTGENFRINSFPQLTIDPVTGQLLVTWADDRYGKYNPSTGASVRTNGDNIVSSSTDGVSWTPTVSVGTSKDEVFGAVASYGGTAAVMSYTRHYAPHGTLLDVAYWPITAKPGSAVVPGAVHRITTQSSDPRVQFPADGADGTVLQGAFIGDYNAMSIGSDRVLHPAWTDFRGDPGTTEPNQDPYTRSIPLG